MATSSMPVGYFDYAELSNNYDEIYETLMSGGIVWMHLNYNNVSNFPNFMGDDGYIRFMVTNWAIIYAGLAIFCPDGSYLVFPNGSYHSGEK